MEGGINLVRGLREELRDFDFHLSEARSMKTACKAKIIMILARIQNQKNKSQNTNSKPDATNTTMRSKVENDKRSEKNMGSAVIDGTSREIVEDGIFEAVLVKSSEFDASELKKSPKQYDAELPTTTLSPPQKDQNSKASVKIATGDSQAIAVIQPGHKGFFKVDLWEALLRIIGFERAANRRSVQNATKTTMTSRPNVMIV